MTILTFESHTDYCILYATVNNSPDAVAKGLAAGADDYLSKRSSDAELLEQLKRASLHTRLPTKVPK